MFFVVFLVVVIFKKLALQDEKSITMPSAGCVFRLKPLCLDQWTPGPQRRSVISLEENMEVVHELEKRKLSKGLCFVLFLIGIAVKHSMPLTCHCYGWTLKALNQIFFLIKKWQDTLTRR